MSEYLPVLIYGYIIESHSALLSFLFTSESDIYIVNWYLCSDTGWFCQSNDLSSSYLLSFPSIIFGLLLVSWLFGGFFARCFWSYFALFGHFLKILLVFACIVWFPNLDFYGFLSLYCVSCVLSSFFSCFISFFCLLFLFAWFLIGLYVS